MKFSDETLREIKLRYRDIFPHDKTKAGVICPKCGSGSGPNGSGMHPRRKGETTLHCFVCNTHGDAIQLYRDINGLNFVEAVKELGDILNIDVGSSPSPYMPKRQATNPPKNVTPRREEPPPPEPDYTAFYKSCAETLQDGWSMAAAKYLSDRGISLHTVEPFWIGFSSASDPVNAPDGKGNIKHPVPRIIIPCSKSHYVARAIEPCERPKLNNKGATITPFNRKGVYESDVVFICEGVFDALSVIEVEAGCTAIALNGVSGSRRLIEMLREKPAACKFVTALDRDAAGNRANKPLFNALRELGYNVIESDITLGCKDANDALIKDRAGFTAAVKTYAEIARRAIQ